MSGESKTHAQKFHANQVFSQANAFRYRIGVKQIQKNTPLNKASETPIAIRKDSST